MTVSLMLDTDSGVTIDPDQEDGHQARDAGGQFRVHHLPPLKLQFTLPPSYPSQVRMNLLTYSPFFDSARCARSHNVRLSGNNLSRALNLPLVGFNPKIQQYQNSLISLSNSLILHQTDGA